MKLAFLLTLSLCSTIFSSQPLSQEKTITPEEMRDKLMGMVKDESLPFDTREQAAQHLRNVMRILQPPHAKKHPYSCTSTERSEEKKHEKSRLIETKKKCSGLIRTNQSYITEKKIDKQKRCCWPFC